MISPEQVEGVF